MLRFYNREAACNNNMLELEGVSKSYPLRRWGRTISHVEALRNLELSVPTGAIFGFLGPNGAGKTTTLNCIAGLLEPDAGTITLDGEPLMGSGGRDALGFLPEQIGLHGHLTARETLAFYGGFHRLETDELESRANESLERLGLGKDGDRPVNGFSLGMRKRLALAMALLHAPRLLLLDEPTSGLDPRGVAALRELLRQLNQDGLTIFLSSHVLGEMQQLCTHVAILNRGQLVLQDEVEAVRATVREAGLRATLRVGGFEPEQLDDIEALPSVHEVRAVPDGRHTRLEIRLRDDDTGALATALVELGLKLYSVEPHDPTLEEVFLARTEAHD